MIYFIKAESGHVKIGHTENNVKERLSGLQTGNQFKLNVLKVIDGDVEQEKIALGKSEEVLKFNFEYVINYEPNVGKIAITGNILHMDEPKKIKEILDDWKKQKKLPKELAPRILNTILSKCNIKALILSQDINLPPHIKMPFVIPSK